MDGRIRRNNKVLLALVAGIVAAGAVTTWVVIHRGPETMPTATCGEVVTQHGSSGTTFREQDAGALACFRQAAASCQKGSLLMTDAGVDSGTRDVVALHRSHGTCAAHLTEQSYNLDWRSTIHHFGCGQVLVTGTGETVVCGNEKFSVPLSTDEFGCEAPAILSCRHSPSFGYSLRWTRYPRRNAPLTVYWRL